MKNTIVTEWTEYKGKKIPKKIVILVPSSDFRKSTKGNGEIIDEVFDYENLQMDREKGL